ncbi:T9SS type B sorting domain-containing protein [Aestuariivivens sediminis]|uniref:T9SS type B sorting domain-containing protein n=1 Tax=Aestuariivivens sediminis TaxID=2913557 RepID=UPI001F566F19|nr:T9SS type B sorting domain-containing protein [Aestuariivivens sediminis]
MKRIVVLLVIVWCNHVYSQKESANWYFGDFAGLDFNTDTPTVLLDGELTSSEGCATISDSNGNLLFYTDGVTIWDRRHGVMPNGLGLYGHKSSTTSALIVPKPGSSSRYYIFTVDQPSYYLKDTKIIHGINYTEVDMQLNNGFGDVVPNRMNIHLKTYDDTNLLEKEYKSTEKLTAVSHSDGSSIWVITFFINRFYAFKIGNGVNENPVVSTATKTVNPEVNDDGANVTAIGYLKASPNGKQVAIAHSSTRLGNPRNGSKRSGQVLLYDFNNATGEVSNQRQLFSNGYPYGVEFSPNSKRLYITNNVFDESDNFIESNLFQFDLESANIEASRKTISVSRMFAGALQLALNGKIYRAGYPVLSSGSSLSVIHLPNYLGSSCDYKQNAVSLGGKAVQLGLPPFVQSLFLYTFDYESTCLGYDTHFFITSEEPYDGVVWDFGDGHQSTDIDPYYKYEAPGVYTVSLTLSFNGVESAPLLKQIIISDPPKVMETTYDLIQCDSFDSDSEDGITSFNLQLANAPITFNTPDTFEVYYYHSLDDAELDITNSMAMDNIYRNVAQNEAVYAKVLRSNTDCYALATINLVTVAPISIDDESLNACVPVGQGIGDFDLETKASEIRLKLNLLADSRVTFHDTQNDAGLGVNPLPLLFRSNEKNIFVRVENDGACYGIGTVDLHIKPFPLIEDQVITVCSYAFPIHLDSGVPQSEISNYNYYWNTGNTENGIHVNDPGLYDVTVTDPVFNCGKTVSFLVKQNEIPVIQSLDTNGRTLKVVLASTDEPFLYSVDHVDNVQESDVFLDLAPGLHTVYVSDLNRCEIIEKDFYIFGFPKYFTPNGDGQNDTWNAYGLKPDQFGTDHISVSIYDRYGKLLKTFNPFYSSGWNGRYNNLQMAADDYWYRLLLPNGEEYIGHFTLKM